jgi:acetyl esterase
MGTVRLIRVFTVLCLVLVLPATTAASQERRDKDVATKATETDVEFAAPDGVRLLLDLYLPVAEGPHPAAVVIHGGRWANGDKGDVAGISTALAGVGFAAFAVNYRLMGQAPYPAQLEDVQAAVRWIRDHAAEYDVDPGLVVAFGASAGGHLAALLATVGEGSLESESRVVAAVSWSGPMDLVSLLDRPLGRVVETLLACRGQFCEEPARKASPRYHVDPSDSPIFLANGTAEVIPVTQAIEMAEALDTAGVPHEVLTVPGPEHAFQYSRTAMDPTMEFLRNQLAAGGEVVASPSAGRPESRGRPSEPSGGSQTVLLIALLTLTGAAGIGAILAFRTRKRTGYRSP